MKFKVGDIVNIVESFSVFTWYTDKPMKIIDINRERLDGVTYKVDYFFDNELYDNNIHENFIELNKNELRKIKLKSL